MTFNPIRIMVVDDHDVVRHGISVFLRAFEDFKLVGLAADGEECISRCAEYAPDVILMDMNMPGMGGIETARVLKTHYPAIRVIALTSFRDPKALESMLEAGAVTCLNKDASIKEIAATIRRAAAIQVQMAPASQGA